MDNSLWQRLIAKIGLAILAIALVDLVYINWWVLKNQNSNIPPEARLVNDGKDQNVENTRIVGRNLIEPTPTPVSSPAPTSQPKVETKTVETKTIVEKETQTIVQTAQKEIFIPIGSGSTKNNSYEDLAGLAVTIDTSKYPNIESAVFEGSIWVADGNGKMFAQLYNSSDKHPVWNSEISTNSAKGVLTTSGNITLDKGAKTYQVQAKTNLISYAAHVENARIKITLK